MQKFIATKQDALAVIALLHGVIDEDEAEEVIAAVVEGEAFDVSDSFPLTAKLIAAQRKAAGWSRLRPKAMARNVAANRLTIYRKINKLAGARDYDALLGEPGTTIDKVVFNGWHPDTCGCHVEYVWHRDHDGPRISERKHRGHLSHQRCPAHEHLGEPVDHHAECEAENQHKNAAVHAAATIFGVEHASIEFSHDEKRQLVLKHAKFRKAKPDAVASLQARVAEKHKGRPAVVLK